MRKLAATVSVIPKYFGVADVCHKTIALFTLLTITIMKTTNSVDMFIRSAE